MAISLTYEKRDTKKNPNTLRRSGKMPAVFYGKKTASTPVAVSTKEFAKVWKKAGENTVVNLEGGGEEVQALIHDVDKHPVTDAPRHVDFYVFEKGQKLKVKIPIEFTGAAPAVKDLGGVLVKVMHELEIEAEPKNLPHIIAVALTPLAAFGNVITAKDVKLPEGVLLAVSPDDIVASVYEPKEEKIEEAPPPDLSQIEVAKKGKEAKEGGEEGAAPAPAGAAGAEKTPAKAEAKPEKK